MCKEMLVNPVNRVVDKEIITINKWRAEEEESLTPKKVFVCANSPIF
jgi:hypothetical protein